MTKFRNYGAVILGHPLKTCSLAPSSGKFASVTCRLEEGEDLGLRRQKMLILAGGEGAIFFSGVDGWAVQAPVNTLPPQLTEATLIKLSGLQSKPPK